MCHLSISFLFIKLIKIKKPQISKKYTFKFLIINYVYLY